MTEKTKQPFILDFDPNHHAVIEPDHDQEPFHFHSRLLYDYALSSASSILVMSKHNCY